ncbi:MAG: class I SAM-dependent methyltransferase [Dehalococcoidia bacterium]
MVKPRIVETDQGIQDEFDVRTYNSMMQGLRDKGWMETDHIITSGITYGLALEIGPGPGYLGLEWLKKTESTMLLAVEISPEMTKIAERNAREYGLEGRVKYVKGDAHQIPFEDNTFDGVFTNGSLHEWSQPIRVFDEVYRVLKPGAKYFMSDMRRDMNPFVKGFMKLMVKPKEIRPSFVSSINASYTIDEIRSILDQSNLKESVVAKTFMGLEITGVKSR